MLISELSIDTRICSNHCMIAQLWRPLKRFFLIYLIEELWKNDDKMFMSTCKRYQGRERVATGKPGKDENTLFA